MKTLFEKSQQGRRGYRIETGSVPHAALPQKSQRTTPLKLPEMAEVDLVRHYTGLSRRAFGVGNGFYPLGSCTMKYNPRINEEMASLQGFRDMHPTQEIEQTQGILSALVQLQEALCEITGMDGVSLQPAAGAHGEWTALCMVAAWHKSRGDHGRNIVLVPDSAHGTNPASATMAGFDVISIPSDDQGFVDLDALKKAVSQNTACLMLTNPSTLGMFEPNIAEISAIVHQAGGLMYYDGANLNALMGLSRPGDMGFDVVHVNLHKTFSTPHGGGGPGSGPVGCKKDFIDFLPAPWPCRKQDGFGLMTPKHSIGRAKMHHGNVAVCLRALTYIKMLGAEGLKEASIQAVINANYLQTLLGDTFGTQPQRHSMHEFVLSLDDFKKQTGASALDVAKAMIDVGMHPPTMYFPLIVKEALMFEPTETESKQTLDEVAKCLQNIANMAKQDGAALSSAPKTTPVGRPDEAAAARTPKVIFEG